MTTASSEMSYITVIERSYGDFKQGGDPCAQVPRPAIIRNFLQDRASKW